MLVIVQYLNMVNAPLAEWVDAADLGSVIERCESSSLLGGTKFKERRLLCDCKF